MNPPDQDEPVFAEPWQAQAFAMVVKLHERGLFTWTEWADALAAEIKGSSRNYYESWLAALEKLVELKELMSRHERELRIDDWDRAARATPHGEPIALSRVRRGSERSPAANRTSPAAHR